MTGKRITEIFGGIFLVVTILGFVPNPIVGTNATFETNIVHDVIHLASSLALLLTALYVSYPSRVLIGFGALYVAIAMLGFFLSVDGMLLQYIAINSADNWLHVIFGVLFINAGFWIAQGEKEAATAVS